MLLADSAQEVNGKLYVLGGGWSVTGPDLPPMGLAIKLDVPWLEVGRPHTFRLSLVDADGHPVRALDGAPVHVAGNFEVGRPHGVPPGSEVDCAFAVNIGPMPLAGGRYTWRLWIDDETTEDWQRPFQVRSRDG